MSQAGVYATSITPPVSPPGFAQVYNQSVQTIANGSLITFDSNAQLVNFTHTLGSNTVTAHDTGSYRIQWILSVQGTGGNFTLLQNGVAIPQCSYTTDVSSLESIGEGIVTITSGDIFQLRNDTGFSIDLVVSAGYTNASLVFEKMGSGGGGGGGLTALVGNIGTANEAGGLINVITAHSTPIFEGAGDTLTLDFGISNLILGSALPSLTSGTANSGIGNGILSAVTSGSDNVAVGILALTDVTTATNNVAIGALALSNFISGSSNVAIGYNAGSAYTGSESNNIIMGNNGIISESSAIRIGQSLTTGIQIKNGSALAFHDYGSSRNIFAGQSAGNATNTASYSTGIGYSSLNALTTGTDNTGLGANTLTQITTNGGNTALGSIALSTCIGDSNTAVGAGSLLALTTGSSNIAVGNSSGSNYTSSESHNILIGNVGITSESDVIRIGTNGTHTSCYIAGIDSVNLNTANVVTESSDQLGTATLFPGTGISITPGVNTITIASTGGGVTWTLITINTTASVNNGYLISGGSPITVTLPATSAVGSSIRIASVNQQWTLAQNAGQQIFFGVADTTVGVGGSLASTNIGDCIELICFTANTQWVVVSSIGNITVT